MNRYDELCEIIREDIQQIQGIEYTDVMFVTTSIATKLAALPIVGKQLEFEEECKTRWGNRWFHCKIDKYRKYTLLEDLNNGACFAVFYTTSDEEIIQEQIWGDENGNGKGNMADAITACTDHAHKLGKQLLGVE